LLTLATGSKVVTLGHTAQTPSGRFAAGHHVSPPTRPFSIFPLIDIQAADTLKQFVETTFDTYRALETDYELGRLIDARVDAISGGFLETRTLMAGVLTDYLAGRYATIHGYSAGSFEERLGFMVKRICPGIRGKDLSRFIKSRDNLAHKMRFRTADKTREYREALHVVNRLILGLLGYTGPYIDCRTWSTVVPDATR
jgi:hypothetical protein